MSASLTQLLADYIDGPRQLRAAVQGLNREQLLARPIAGQWSTLEVVCHLADFEPIFAERMKRILAEEQPLLRGADENCFAAALVYHERNLEEELAIVENTRAQMARILRTLPLEALQRVGIHSERGPLTLEQILSGAIRHIPHHVQFIRGKRQALGLSA
jgi:uncharacterized damage-inducible protein DinB